MKEKEIKVNVVEVSMDEIEIGDILVRKDKELDVETYNFAKVLDKKQTVFNKFLYIMVEGIGKVYQHRQNNFRKIVIDEKKK